MEAYVWFTSTATVLWGTAFLPITIREKKYMAIVTSVFVILFCYMKLLPKEEGFWVVFLDSIIFTLMGFSAGIFMYFMGERHRKKKNGG